MDLHDEIHIAPFYTHPMASPGNRKGSSSNQNRPTSARGGNAQLFRDAGGNGVTYDSWGWFGSETLELLFIPLLEFGSQMFLVTRGD